MVVDKDDQDHINRAVNAISLARLIKLKDKSSSNYDNRQDQI